MALPVYEPDAYLVHALRSVLRQDLGPERMQIVVVDDASTRSDVRTLIAEAAPAGRVELHRAMNNQGLAANWNRCIQLSRGEVVHILHQDDWVENGFYERLLPAFAADPAIGMAFCRHAFVDCGRVTRRSHRERWSAGVLSEWLGRISERQRIQCAAALVRRSVYEALGGYRADLDYALDWEMWVRIAAHFRVWYAPGLLAYYRRHGESETARLKRDDRVRRDVLNAIEAFAAHLPPARRERLTSAAYAAFARRALKQATSDPTMRGERIAERLTPIRFAIERMTRHPLRARLYRARAARLEGAAREADS